MTDKFGLLILKANMDMEINKEQLAWQKKSVALQEKLQMLGGAGDYLGAAGPQGLSASFTKAVENLERAFDTYSGAGVAGENPQGAIDRGRMAFSTLDDLINNLKLRGVDAEGNTKRLGAGAFGPMVGQAIAGRTEDIKLQVQKIKK